MEKTSCVILNYNDVDHVLSLLNLIKDYDSIDNIVIVDNCSTDDSWERLQLIQTDKVCICQTEKNGGYGYGNNFGVRYASDILNCSYILIVNPDVIFDNELVVRLKKEIIGNSTIGVVSAIQRSGNSVEISRSAWCVPTIKNYIFSQSALTKHWGNQLYYSWEYLHSQNTVEVDCVAGSLLMVSAVAFEKCGGYDEDIFLYCEETTLGCKMKKHGYKCVLCSDVSYLHIHGVTISKNISSAIKRKKILLKSHRLVIKKYLRADTFACCIDRLVGGISLAETALKAVLVKVKCLLSTQRNCNEK